MVTVIIILVVMLIIGAIVPLKKANPDCPKCEGKGGWKWYGFDGLGDHWEDCDCLK